MPREDGKQKIYDTIIVGAGPGGSTCACLLAQKGAVVLLLERFSFPREKLCAGGVPSAAFDIIPVSYLKNECLPLKNYIFSYRGEKEKKGTLKGESIFSVERSTFDMALAKQAQESGALLLENHRVTDIIEHRDVIEVVCENGAMFKGRTLVGADGGHSLTARKFFPHMEKRGKGDVGICGYYRYHAHPDLMKLYADTVHLDLNFIGKGVAGILPKKDYLWLGVYKCEKDNLVKLKEGADRFIEKMGFTGKKGDFRGLLIPLYRKKQNLVRGNILLAGEAAGLVNPLSGEGIKPAMDSGKIAAEVVFDYLRSTEKLEVYSERIHEEIGKELLIASQFMRIAFTFPSIAYDGMTHVADDAVRILNGDLSYGDFMNRLKKKIMRKMGLKA